MVLTRCAPQPQRRYVHRCILLLVFIGVLSFYADIIRLFYTHLEVLKNDLRPVSGFHYLDKAVDHNDKCVIPIARSVKPSQLLAEAKSQKGRTVHNVDVPKIIHQTWIDTNLPPKFRRWTRKWRLHHPNWTYVLWTHTDLRQLIAQEYEWLLATYDALPGDIFRADLARNALMYSFGGMYSDLDNNCLGPFDDLFRARSPELIITDDGGRKHVNAWFGTMQCRIVCQHSIPNAWMAAQPGHPFFLLPMLAVRDAHQQGLLKSHKIGPEELTGPIALRHQYLRYRKAFASPGDYNRLFDKAYDFGADKNLSHDIFLLDPSVIYPYSWECHTKEEFKYCSTSSEHFDEEMCVEVLKTRSRHSLCISHWSHSWSYNGTDAKAIAKLG